jgi:hypothetical protein
MGFKVTVHKNGVKHGESHYTSEAVAVGMAKKMKNAGASVSVARCNGSGCGCMTSMKANPRRNGTTSANAAASRSLVHRFGLMRNRRRNPSMTEAQANTLIRQLGGVGKLTAMIGASGFARGTTDGHPSLSFK